MADFSFPTADEQKRDYFGKDGIVAAAAESLGLVLKKSGSWNVDEKIKRVITDEFLD